jgi:hypothetical protein
MTTPIGRVRQALPAAPPPAPRVRHSADGVDQLDLLAELAEVSG